MRALSGIVCYVAAMHPTQNGDGEFARLLAAIQKRAGLSDQAIADIAGVNRSQVWRWTHSGSAPGYEPVRRLAAWLVAERPEVADAALALLAAAGYETLPGAAPSGPAPAVFPLPPPTEAMARQLAPFLAEAEARVRVAQAANPGQRLTGKQVYPDLPEGAAYWDALIEARFPPEQLAPITATMLAMSAERAEIARRKDGHAAGLIRRPVLQAIR